MASILNRAPFVVEPKSPKKTGLSKSFRSKPAALAYKAELDAAGTPATVLQAAEGFWDATVRLKGADGKRHDETRRFDTEAEANAWAEAEEAKLKALRKTGTPASAAKTAWKDAVDEWYREVGSKLNGKGVIEYNMPKVKATIGEDRAIDSITVALLREWRDARKAEGYAPSTIANYRQIISGTFKYWISEKDFPGINPVKSVVWEKPDNVSPPPSLSQKPKNGEKKSEEERLFDAIRAKSPWLVPVVEWAMATAMRRGEIAGMHWEHLDLDEMKLFIPKTKSDWRKKNTEAPGREIPLWPELIAILDKHFPDKEKRKGKVFKGTVNSMTHSFEERAQEAGLGNLSFHSLRKIGTSRLAKKLPNVIELSKITAHSDLSTLSRRYYGVELKDLADKIGGTKALADPLKSIKASLATSATKGGKDGKKAAELLALLIASEETAEV